MSTKRSKAMQLIDELTGSPLTLNNLIEALRLSTETPQTEFAKQLKISPSHLCDIEKGRKLVSPERAVRFAKILGYPEKLFLQLALQGILDEAKLDYKVSVEPA